MTSIDLHEGVDVAVGDLVLQAGIAGAVVRGKVKVVEARALLLPHAHLHEAPSRHRLTLDVAV